jgi:hypothetical protein
MAIFETAHFETTKLIGLLKGSKLKNEIISHQP